MIALVVFAVISDRWFTWTDTVNDVVAISSTRGLVVLKEVQSQTHLNDDQFVAVVSTNAQNSCPF